MRVAEATVSEGEADMTEWLERKRHLCRLLGFSNGRS
jgi:hypothetical protein